MTVPAADEWKWRRLNVGVYETGYMAGVGTYRISRGYRANQLGARSAQWWIDHCPEGAFSYREVSFPFDRAHTYREAKATCRMHAVALYGGEADHD